MVPKSNRRERTLQENKKTKTIPKNGKEDPSIINNMVSVSENQIKNTENSFGSNEIAMEHNNTELPDSKMNKSRRKQRKTTKLCYMRNANTGPFKMSSKMYKEIRSLQFNTNTLIPFASFIRVVKEILKEYACTDMRIQLTALKALQESAELYMTQYFEDSYQASLHANRVTLQVTDMRLVRRLRGLNDVINH